MLIATPEAAAWYDPTKPMGVLEYEWIVKNLDLRGRVVLDVGTHHGQYALILASMGCSKLTCIDAVESNCAIAEANLCLNGFDPDVRHLAVTTRQGKVQFTGDSNGRVVERGVTEVNAVTLPTIGAEASIIKLDIEGEEFAVLPQQLGDLPKLETLIVEIHPWKTRDPHKLVPVLQEHFSNLQWVNREAMRVEPYPSDANWISHTTIICRR